MKYLKRFNESNLSANFTDMIRNIEDILLPISDMGYNPSVQYGESIDLHFKWLHGDQNDPSQLIIRIVLYGDKILEVTDDVNDDFGRLNDYLESKGYSMSIIGVVSGSTGDIKLTYNGFCKYLRNSFSIKSFRNLIFVATRKNESVL